jgi:hypothetical protein
LATNHVVVWRERRTGCLRFANPRRAPQVRYGDWRLPVKKAKMTQGRAEKRPFSELDALSKCADGSENAMVQA